MFNALVLLVWAITITVIILLGDLLNLWNVVDWL